MRLAIGILLVAGTASGYSGGPPVDHVRIPWPAEPLQDCARCHTGTVNGFPGTLELLGLPAAYEPDLVYDLTVSLADPDPTRSIYGFQIASVDAALAEAGIVEQGDATASERAVDTTRGLGFVRQRTGGNRATAWAVRWTAPPPRGGDARFYLCANAGDDDSTSFGDHVFCTSRVVPAAACDPSLAAVAGLTGVKEASSLRWSWTEDPLAVRGYRLYAVATKEEIALANSSTPGALRACPAPTAADVSCLEPAPPPGAWHYQVVGVCAAGQEGPN